MNVKGGGNQGYILNFRCNALTGSPNFLDTRAIEKIFAFTEGIYYNFYVRSLTHFEKFVERLVERPFGRLFKVRLHPADLTKALRQAMEQGRHKEPPGHWLVPNYYLLQLSEQDYRTIQQTTSLKSEAARQRRELLALMTENDYQPAGGVQIEFTPLSQVRAGQVRVQTEFRRGTEPVAVRAETRAETQPLVQASLPAAEQWRLYLPEQTIVLGRPLIRLGYSSNNDVVLAHPSVGKYHAQLRWRNQTYHIQTLNQRYPLELNGKPVITPMALQPGDQLLIGQIAVKVDVVL